MPLAGDRPAPGWRGRRRRPRAREWHAWGLPSRPPSTQDIQRDWPATVSALPIGTSITGEVIGRQPFGIFVRIDGAPNALGLAEILFTPPDTVLPPLGAQISGRVIWHANHNCQVKIRLSEWGDAEA
jgi:hypothetical protein